MAHPGVAPEAEPTSRLAKEDQYATVPAYRGVAILWGVTGK